MYRFNHHIAGLVYGALLVGGGDEIGFVFRRRNVDTVFEAGMKEFIESIGVGISCIVEVFDGVLAEVDAEHGGYLRNL